MSKKRRADKATSVETGPKSKDKGSDLSPKVPQRDKIDFQLSIRERDDLTEKQKQLIDLILDRDTRIVFVAGPAGCSKTFTAVLAGLMAMNKRSVSDILYIRSVVESASRSLGYLPGEAGSKMEPYARPLMEKMEEMLPTNECKALIKDGRIDIVPVNYLRGASFNAKFIICDEAQNLDFKEGTTVITRIGRFSKLLFLADPDQSDLNGRSGFMKMFDLFNDEESRAQGIHCFSFTKEDIVRSGVLKYIADKLDRYRIASSKTEPMFPPK